MSLEIHARAWSKKINEYNYFTFCENKNAGFIYEQNYIYLWFDTSKNDSSFEYDVDKAGFIVSYCGVVDENPIMSVGFDLKRGNFETWTELIPGLDYKVIWEIREKKEIK